jgi:hypothetical protein
MEEQWKEAELIMKLVILLSKYIDPKHVSAHVAWLETICAMEIEIVPLAKQFVGLLIQLGVNKEEDDPVKNRVFIYYL